MQRAGSKDGGSVYTEWDREVQNGNSVSSVFGRTGAVVADAGDYLLSQINPADSTVPWYREDFPVNGGVGWTNANMTGSQVPTTIGGAANHQFDINGANSKSIAANVLTTSVAPFIEVVTRTGAARQIHLDFVSFRIGGLTR